MLGFDFFVSILCSILTVVTHGRNVNPRTCQAFGPQGSSEDRPRSPYPAGSLIDQPWDQGPIVVGLRVRLVGHDPPLEL